MNFSDVYATFNYRMICVAVAIAALFFDFSFTFHYRQGPGFSALFTNN